MPRPRGRVPLTAEFGSAAALWRPCPGVEGQTVSTPAPLPLNARSPLARFSTDLFEGSAQLWLAGLPESPDDGTLENRLSLFTVSGKFRKPLSADDVYTGQEYTRPLTNVPGAWVFNSALSAVKYLSPTSNFGDTNNPFVITPLISGVHMMVISTTQPDLTKLPYEDCSALGPEYTDPIDGGPAPPSVRRRVFADAGRRTEMMFGTEAFYTFHFFQNIIDMGKLQLNLGWSMVFDLSRHLDGQPLQLMSKVKSTGEFLWKFEFWHKELLPAAEEAATEAANS